MLVYLNFSSIFIYIFFNVLTDINISIGGLKWNRTIDLTLIRRAL